MYIRNQLRIKKFYTRALYNKYAKKYIKKVFTKHKIQSHDLMVVSVETAHYNHIFCLK